MALIDKASLLMVPSVYEDGTLYNVLPSGNKAPDETGSHNGYDQTRADFTFSRGSNLSATRIGPNGLIEKGRENLLLQSNNFDTTWLKVNATRTSGQSGYDGSNDAWLLSATNTFANVYQSISQTGLVTFSVYAKAGTGNWMMMRLNGSANNLIYVDLANQVFGGTSAQYVDGTITDIGSGWRRVSITINQTSYNNAHIYVAADDLDLNTSNETIYIQDAQLELGLVSTPVIRTGATTATAGVLENTPRIDYSSGARALLLESQRTNLITNSEYINTTDWNHQGVTSSVNTSETTSPEGVYNAVKFTATNTDPYIFRSVSVSTGDNTFSFYVKGTGSSVGKTARILFWYIGTATGTQTSHNFTLTDQWQRVDATTSPTGAGTLTFRIDIPADSAVIGDVCYLYGLQIESGSHVSSYVPTYGSAATRGADVCNSGGSAESINSTEGVAFVECSFLADDAGENRDIYISDGTATNRIRIRLSSSDVVNFLVYNGSIQANMNYTLPNPTNNNKIAIKWKANDFALWVNGTERETDTSGTTFSANTLDEVSFFTTYNQLQHFHSNVKQLAVFDEALSDSELATLTTL